MLLRICLIIALVGSLAAAVVNFVKVKDVITTTITERETEKTAKVTALGERDTARKNLKATGLQLTNTMKDLARTKSDLDGANGKVEDLTKQNADQANHLKQVQAARDDLDAKLAKWDQLHVTPQQVIDDMAELKTTITARDAYIAENKLLYKKVGELTNEIASIIGTNTEPPLPLGLKGTVMAVDPKYGFVALNIGEDNEVVPLGVMMVARGDKFIGKVRISSVTKNQSIANVIPQWSQGEIMEGDEVLHQ